jgi:hypothetical protein
MIKESFKRLSSLLRTDRNRMIPFEDSLKALSLLISSSMSKEMGTDPKPLGILASSLVVAIHLKKKPIGKIWGTVVVEVAKSYKRNPESNDKGIVTSSVASLITGIWNLDPAKKTLMPEELDSFLEPGVNNPLLNSNIIGKRDR